MKKSKSIDYILGMITGISIMIAALSLSTPLKADIYTSLKSPTGDSWDPIYVKVVK